MHNLSNIMAVSVLKFSINFFLSFVETTPSVRVHRE